ncbi:superoxide dismutase, Cu-Zn family [Pseudoxanthomonas sp. CF385]|uniref:superoxide dismutase family protein n=1 Tax=Pseudoxanthomonas sp. CF385 TaxID=1881042 RepID=UPI00087EAF09|nr:superoxide dismutase family protein [Pseudoxanthomonas sp. CF385]SDQ24868.1 superoxide dismutase, Cu-Zn family [Pseudoxanthomonas sp. CF385]
MRIALLAAASALTLAACSTTPSTPTASTPEVPTTSTAKQAIAVLASASASRVSGSVTLVPMGKGLHLTGEVGGLPANSTHAFHIHEKGDCSAADASSAGPHFNPFNAAHGKAGSGAHHAGDMNNLTADAEGVAKINVHLEGVTLGGGAVNDVSGRALIVHAAADDYASQPAGNAGARVACGIIKVTQ